MQGTDTETQVVPRGWPPEAHLVSASKPIVVAFLTLYAAGVGLSVWCLIELRSMRAEIHTDARHETRSTDGE